MRENMEYFKPDKAVPFVLDSMTELFNTMKVHCIDVSELEKAFADIFINYDKYDPELVVQSLRVLHQSAVAAQHTINRKDFDSKLEEERLKKEYTYADACAEMGIGYSTLKSMVGANQIEVKRYSTKNVKITQREIDRYKAARKN